MVRTGRVVSSNHEVKRPLHQCILPIEKIPGMEHVTSSHSSIPPSKANQRTMFPIRLKHYSDFSGPLSRREKERFSIFRRTTEDLFRLLQNDIVPMTPLFVFNISFSDTFCPILLALKTYYNSTLHKPCFKCKVHL